MAKCDVCGNDYDRPLKITTSAGTFTFDSFECAIHKLAPLCDYCGVRIIGHGIQNGDTFYCCAHCAHMSGVTKAVDNIEHAASS